MCHCICSDTSGQHWYCSISLKKADREHTFSSLTISLSLCLKRMNRAQSYQLLTGPVALVCSPGWQTVCCGRCFELHLDSVKLEAQVIMNCWASLLFATDAGLRCCQLQWRGIAFNDTLCWLLITPYSPESK